MTIKYNCNLPENYQNNSHILLSGKNHVDSLYVQAAHRVKKKKFYFDI